MAKKSCYTPFLLLCVQKKWQVAGFLYYRCIKSRYLRRLQYTINIKCRFLEMRNEDILSRRKLKKNIVL